MSKLKFKGIVYSNEESMTDSYFRVSKLPSYTKGDLVLGKLNKDKVDVVLYISSTRAALYDNSTRKIKGTKPSKWQYIPLIEIIMQPSIKAGGFVPRLAM